MTIKVEEQPCVTHFDPAANTVITSKEFLSKVEYNVVTHYPAIIINTKNGSIKNPGYVAAVKLSSLDYSFKIEVRTLTSLSALISLKTKSVTAKQLKVARSRIS